jgi:hypothetical protein
MIKNAKLIISGFLLIAFVGVFANAEPAHATATTTASGQALEIAPPVINLTADPGETITTQITLRDVSSGSLIVNNEINDFVASSDESGDPKILLDNSETSPYSLKDWINPISALNLTSKQIKTLSVTIKVPTNAAPGGYYGVIRFTGTPAEMNTTGVSLSASLGALVLLRVNGTVTEKMSIKEFSIEAAGKTGTFFESTPFDFVERIENTGNIHEQPTGQIIITDMFNNKVAVSNINEQLRNVLPKSIRKFNQTLDSQTIGSKILFGRYTANLKITYGSDKTVLTSSMTFWVIPYRLIILAIVVLVGGFIVLRTLIRRYNNHIIKKSQQRTKR